MATSTAVSVWASDITNSFILFQFGAKIVQGERNTKRIEFFFISEPPLIFAKQSSARREKNKINSFIFYFSLSLNNTSEPPPIFAKQSSVRREKYKSAFYRMWKAYVVP